MKSRTSRNPNSNDNSKSEKKQRRKKTSRDEDGAGKKSALENLVSSLAHPQLQSRREDLAETWRDRSKTLRDRSRKVLIVVQQPWNLQMTMD